MANLDTYIFIKWSDKDYSTGIKSIDDQHKKLIDLINEIYQSIIDYKRHEVTSSVLVKLQDYAQEHFAYEEKLFKQLGYEDSEDHIQKHRDFMNKVADFKQQVTVGGDVTFAVTNFLRTWLRTHIQNEDRHYAPFFIKNGIK